MRRIGVLSGIVLSIGSCKPMYDRDGLDPVSKPEYVVSEGGTILTALPGKEGGICMVKSLLGDPKTARLVTTKGALSEKQLKSALRFMGYGEHVASTIGAGIAGGVAGAAVVIGKVGAAGVTAAALLNPVVLGVTIGVTAAGVMGYRIIKGNVRGEKAGPISVHSIVGSVAVAGGAVPVGAAASSLLSIAFSPITEFFHRRGRLGKALNDEEELRFTEKRMRKLIEEVKAGSERPEYPNGCDHIKTDLQQE